MLMREESLKNFGTTDIVDSAQDKSLINRHLRWIGSFASAKPWLVIGLNLVVLCIGMIGISLIEVNDNPVKWFKKSHEIRVADKVLNEHFGGTYEAYLVLAGSGEELSGSDAAGWLEKELQQRLAQTPAIQKKALEQVKAAAGLSANGSELADALSPTWEDELDALDPTDDEGYDAWSEALDILEGLRNRDQIFKRPDVLRYLAELQGYLQEKGYVGKANSVADVVKKVHQELFEGDPGRYHIPDTVNAVAQTLISFQNSHKPDDLWHLVTPDYSRANLWLQLKSGDNKDMERVVAAVERYMKKNPAPVGVEHNWAGLTYINVVWQDKMVGGMRSSLLGSFVVVFVMMTVLFRSPLWGLLAMIPLTFTITVIYGVIGLIGKDYDMPVAVLSSLTLGLAVDFAIHFLQRSRMSMEKFGDWSQAVKGLFEEPARAITRNTIVIAVGFTPLLFAPLIPYQTVGIFLACIMLYSGLATLWMLPAVLSVSESFMFRKEKAIYKQREEEAAKEAESALQEEASAPVDEDTAETQPEEKDSAA
jgi:predicted RND superfamily exporter protein